MLASYIAQRTWQLIPVLILVSIAVFLIVRIIPGDPVLVMLGIDPEERVRISDEQYQALQHQLGFDRPIYVQYLNWTNKIVQGTDLAAPLTRYIRAEMLEQLKQDYVRTAWAKGMPSRIVIVKHALKNSLIAAVTVVGLQTARLLGGSTIVETVFSWPGVGKLLIEGIYSRDYPIVQGSVLIIAVTYVFINLFVDIVYKWLDPRITLE